MSTNKISIEAIIKAEPKKVWDYYTQPNHITQWNFADPSWHCPKAENDLSVGGKYLARMEAKDGSFGFDFELTYTQMEIGKSYTCVMSDNREVIVSLEENNDETKITVNFDPENENPIDMQKGGWQAILNNFKAYTENH